jgi:crotonobetainyl-CoA:carnitine CoA-transferase CaiB-like acyl-CoA transferase
MIERHPHPTLGEVLFHGNPLQLADMEPRARALAPELGADNALIYGELGLSAADLRELTEAGVL